MSTLEFDADRLLPGVAPQRHDHDRGGKRGQVEQQAMDGENGGVAQHRQPATHQREPAALGHPCLARGDHRRSTSTKVRMSPVSGRK
ncbi:MAG: hypothetical protein U1E60_09130 [Reyranellaceae bacterium]